MEEEDLESKVVKNIVYITQKTTNIGLLNIHLIQNGVILPVEKETVESHSTHETQVYHLMMLLTRKGPRTKGKLLKALRETCNGHVAQILDDHSNSTRSMMGFSRRFSLDLSTSTAPINYDRINPLLDKVQELVNVLRVEDIVAASKTQFISVKEESRENKTEVSQNKKAVFISQVEKPIEKREQGILGIRKAMVIGDGSTGKTCMINVWTTGIFPTEYVPTVFDNHQTFVKVDDNLVNIGIWDTAGQEEYERLRPLSYPLSDICIIVFALNNLASLSNAKQTFLPEFKNVCPQTPIFLVGNKLDLRKSQDNKGLFVTTGEGEKMAEKMGAKAYFECSAQTGEGMKEILPAIMNIILGMANERNTGYHCCSIV